MAAKKKSTPKKSKAPRGFAITSRDILHYSVAVLVAIVIILVLAKA